MIDIVSGLLKLDASPFLKSGYLFKRLSMQEELGNSIASGTISFTTPGLEGSMDIITTTQTVTIKLEQTDGIQYEILGFIVDRRVVENEVEFEFLSTTKNFIVENRWLTYNSLFDALDTAYPNKKVFEVDSDINSNIPVKQLGETDFSLCKRLAQCYRYDAVYAFGLEGLLIKDTRTTKEELVEVPERLIYQNSKAVMTQDLDMSYRKFMDFEPEESTHSDSYFQAYQYNDLYNIVRSDSSMLLRNYYHNSKYRTSMYGTAKFRYLRELPQYKLGDVVLYYDHRKFPFSRFIARKMVTEIEYQKVTVDVELSGLDNYE